MVTTLQGNSLAAGRTAILGLIEKLDGWPLGFRMLNDALAGETAAARQADPTGAEIARRVVEELSAYLGEEVPSTAGEPLHSFRRRSAPLSIGMFGGLAVWRGEEKVEEREWRRKRAKLLLAYLLLSGPEGASRQAIAEKLWRDALPGEANDQFYAHLRALRLVLEPSLQKGGDSKYIRSRHGRYAFAFDVAPRWDLAEFTRHRDAGRCAERQGRVAEAVSAYEVAVSLYTGELLPEPLFADVAWLYNPRVACHEDVISMRTFLAENAAGQKHWEDALGHWKAILEIEPARESAHAWMMAAYALLGRRDDALAQFRSCRAALRRELDAAPLPSTVGLYQSILNNYGR